MKTKSLVVYEAKAGNAVVQVRQQRQVKNGVTYQSFVVTDYSSGARKRWTYADMEDAKEKADELAARLRGGQLVVDHWPDQQKREAARAAELAEQAGFSLLRGTSCVAEAVKLAGGLDQVIMACRYYREHPPVKPLKPKTVNDSVKEFLGRQGRLSTRRQRTLRSQIWRTAKPGWSSRVVIS
jgi:hypothetical protein